MKTGRGITPRPALNEGQDLLNARSRFEAILLSARRQAQGIVVLCPSLPTQQWAKWVKSEGPQNGFDLEAKYPCRQNNCLTAAISPRYLCHFDASNVHLIGPDPSCKETGACSQPQAVRIRRRYPRGHQRCHRPHRICLRSPRTGSRYWCDTQMTGPTPARRDR
jgi:hypothetical protein